MFSALYNILISPIELVLEIIFELMFRLLGHGKTNQGLAVIGVSLAVSLLTLPLYRRADAVQQKARDIQQKMSRWVTHIRKTFKGDERFMMLRTYYRINGYSPLSALNGSISLLLEIPFFMAAYHFLSHLEVLNGASFWIIRNLGNPDGLIKLGAVSINVLPILMTAINCIASAVYLKGFPVKDKVQTYGMAVIFLVLLYNSPSGLVVYWTCNNIFSLVKNIFYKLKHPREIAYTISAIVGTFITVAVILSGTLDSKKKLVAIIMFQFIAILPLICYLAKNYIAALEKQTSVLLGTENSSSFASFFLAGIFMTLLFGILIPASVISSSPAEFVNIGDYRNPFLFLINSTCYAFGFFLVWMGIIRHMLPQNGKQVLNLLLWIVSGTCLLNYMCFGQNLGTLSPLLSFENGLDISKAEKLINLLALCGACCILKAVFRFRQTVLSIYIVLILCISGVSIYQIHTGQQELAGMEYIKDVPQDAKIEPVIPLSKKGKNVIVFMLDRAISGYVPYLMEEKPFLKDQFAGFTYYPNTLSFGRVTNFGAPPIFGGYEYTPVEMNRRASESLATKHNESLKMLPVLFGQNHYKVTVCDPPYAGYKYVPDLSIFKEYPFISAHMLEGVVKNEKLIQSSNEKPLFKNNRNFFCYSIFKTLPLAVSKIWYDRGDYYSSTRKAYGNVHVDKLTQLADRYAVLTMLPELTKIEDSAEDTFLSIQNSATHAPHVFQLPDYELTGNVNNKGYKTAADGHIPMNAELLVAHYHTNMAAFLQLGKWFDFMRENGVYDNTRIILVADHGYRFLHQFDYMIVNKIYDEVHRMAFDVMGVNPLLMVKDFNATEFTTSNEFMTHADTPTLAVQGVIDNPVNPFTGKEISDKEKTAHPQIITTSGKHNINVNNGNIFDTSDGKFLSVHDDIFNPDNWEIVGPGTAP